MMKQTLSIVLLILTQGLTAQNITEAVRYSQLEQFSTARVSGVAGAFGAMGGDLGVLTINPAGIADFRKSDFSFSPNFYGVTTEAKLKDAESTQSEELNSRIAIGSIGVVFAHSPRNGVLQTSNLALSINNLSSYRQNIYYEGLTKGSVTSRFLEVANGKTVEQLDEFEGYPAYVTDAIFDLDGDGFYDSDFKPTTVVNKSQNIMRYGRMNEINIAWAGKTSGEGGVNFGLGVGIPIVSFEEVKTYKEQDEVEDFIPTFNSLSYEENLLTTGAGINIKGGVQAQFAEIFRAGVSLQSPSWLTLTDEYTTSMTYNYTLDQIYNSSYDSPEGTFQYRLVTPWRATGSGGVLFRGDKLNAFVDVDVEYLDYTNNELNFEVFGGSSIDLDRQQEVNNAIIAQLDNAVNLRVGGEIAYAKVRGRAGVAFTDSPYGADDQKNVAYSLGFGFRGESFYLDLAYGSRAVEEGYVPYLLLNSENNQVVTLNKTVDNLAVTIGFKF